MAEYMTLVGAEQVQSAASSIRYAADEMKSAAATIEYAVERQMRFMDDWLNRFEAVVSRAEAIGAEAESS